MAKTPLLPRFLPLLLFLGGLLLICPHGPAQAVHGAALHNVTVEDGEVDGRRSLYPSCVDWYDGWPGLGGGAHFVVGSAAPPLLLSISDAGVMQQLLPLNFELEHGCCLSILGIKIDPRENRVLIVLHSFDGSCAPFDALAAYDLSSKRRIFLAVLHNVSVAGSDSWPMAHHVCIDHHGNAYVTNSANNFVWKVDPNGMPSVFVLSPLFLSHLPVVDNPAAQEEEHPRSPASPHHMGLNGIVYAPPGYLLLGQSNSGMLFRISLHDSSAQIIECGLLFPGINGINLRTDGTLALVSSNTIWVLKSQDSWNTAHVVDTLPLSPSDGALAVDITFREGQQPYILHSYVHELFTGKEVERKAFFIQEVQFPSDQDDPIWIIVGIIILLIFIFLWRFQMNYFFKQYTKKRV